MCARHAAAAASTARLDAFQVLVVDDEAVSLQFVRLHLTRAAELPLAVLTATSVREARKLLETHAVDLVLLDWEMPVTPGIELLRWMRRSEPVQDIPVIMMTARGTREDVEEALRAGTTDYLVKPIRRQGLLDKLRRHLPSTD